MSGPGEGERYRKAGEALILEAFAITLSSFVHPLFAWVASFLAVWYCYSKLMFYGLFEGDFGRLKAFLLSSIPGALLTLTLRSSGAALGLASAFVYWVRIWKSR